MRRAITCFLFCLIISTSSFPIQADELPPSVLLEGLIGHPQEHNLSCESRSATDLAAFWNIVFTEDEFFHRLPKSDNPHRGFLGDVDFPAGSMPPTGYGVYVEPIAATLRSFGLNAKARHNWSIDNLKEELTGGRPVLIWATYDMKQPGVETWISSDGASSVVVRWQHTFVTVGYDEGGLYLVDAYDGMTKYFSYEAFIPAWEQLGSMAVTANGFISKFGHSWKMMEAHRGKRPNQLIADGRWTVGPE